MATRKRVLLIFGGDSSEHDVSVASARNVRAAIDESQYDVSLCFIDKAGAWWLVSRIGKGGRRERVTIMPGRPVLVTEAGVELAIDVIFPTLHGRGGEDGAIQGVAQTMRVPIVGSGAVASAIGWDKHATKKIASAHGIRVVPHVTHHEHDDEPDFVVLSGMLGESLFVKPTQSGSSVGVSKAAAQHELAAALAEAHKHHKVALVEQEIKGRELEVAVLGRHPHHQVSGVGEVVIGETFYSYAEKYGSESMAKVVIPADISEAWKSRIQDTARRIYELLQCEGLARVDFFLGDDGTLYFNEINTLPGFTDISMYPKLWQQEGIGYEALVGLLLADALENATMVSET